MTQSCLNAQCGALAVGEHFGMPGVYRQQLLVHCAGAVDESACFWPSWFGMQALLNDVDF
jgi:hypothetical protein